MLALVDLPRLQAVSRAPAFVTEQADGCLESLPRGFVVVDDEHFESPWVGRPFHQNRAPRIIPMVSSYLGLLNGPILLVRPVCVASMRAETTEPAGS